MKTTKKALVIFLIALMTISSISSIGGFAGFVRACEGSYDIELNTINGVSPWNGPFVNPIIIAGSASSPKFRRPTFSVSS